MPPVEKRRRGSVAGNRQQHGRLSFFHRGVASGRGKALKCRSCVKGKIIWEAVVSALIELVDEWRTWPIAPRSDQHKKPVQSQIRW